MSAAGVDGADAADAAQKRVRALQKKLRQIQQLKEKRDSEGEGPGSKGGLSHQVQHSTELSASSLHACSYCCCRTVVQIRAQSQERTGHGPVSSISAGAMADPAARVLVAVVLLCRCATGVKLEPEQIQKIEAEASVIAEIRELGGNP